MTTPAFLLEALREAVAQPKAEATSTAPYRQSPPKQPLTGRAIIFDARTTTTRKIRSSTSSSIPAPSPTP